MALPRFEGSKVGKSEGVVVLNRETSQLGAMEQEQDRREPFECCCSGSLMYVSMYEGCYDQC
jgi:hypothetical protein